jgi:hypothetical protein
MGRPMKRLTVLILGFAMLVAGGLASLGPLGCAGIPSDNAMLDHFSKHAGEFQELLDLYRADPGLEQRAAANAASSDPYPALAAQSESATQTRYEQLRKLLKVESVELFEDRPNALELVYRTFGGDSPGYKGYLCSQSAPSPLVTSTDDFEGDDGAVYRRIDTSWFIFCVRSPGPGRVVGEGSPQGGGA